MSTIRSRFEYHPPTEDQAVKYQAIRSMGYSMAQDILRYAPDSRERSVAMTKLDEVIMWTNAAIARNE